MKKLLLIVSVVFFISCQSGNDKNKSENDVQTQTVALVQDTLNISGMHCDMCVSSIEKGVNELEGIEFVKASLNDSIAIVEFDNSKTNLEEIEKAIEKRGYAVKDNL